MKLVHAAGDFCGETPYIIFMDSQHCFSVMYFQYRTGMSFLCFLGLRRSFMQMALK